jgi:4-hydroxybenzoate polyprenyltransferase
MIKYLLKRNPVVVLFPLGYSIGLPLWYALNGNGGGVFVCFAIFTLISAAMLTNTLLKDCEIEALEEEIAKHYREP